MEQAYDEQGVVKWMCWGNVDARDWSPSMKLQ
jgi:hypothetical protein